jgi:hypothetical protein
LSGILLTGKLFSRTNGALFHETPLFSRTNGRWPKGKAICNSAAVSWGFAIPTSTVFCFLSNRIINSYIHGRRIANSPERKIIRIANPNAKCCQIANPSEQKEDVPIF